MVERDYISAFSPHTESMTFARCFWTMHLFGAHFAGDGEGRHSLRSFCRTGNIAPGFSDWEGYENAYVERGGSAVPI